MSRSSFFRESFGSQLVNGSQTLLRSARHNFYTTFSLIRDKLSWKKLQLVRSESLGLFVNSFISNDKYSRQNREVFAQEIQMQLSQKPKTFFQFFIAFLKSTLNFECFEKRRMTSILVIIGRISRNKLKRYYLQNQRVFLNFSLRF